MPIEFWVFIGLGVFFGLVWLYFVYRKASADPVEAARELYEGHNLNQPAFISHLQVGRNDANTAASRSKQSAITASTALYETRTTSAITLMESENDLAETPTQLARKNELAKLGHINTVLAQNNQRMVTEKANSEGRSLGAYMLAEQYQAEVEKEEGLARVRTDEELRRAHIELLKRWGMIQQNLTSAFTYQERLFKYLEMHWNYLDGLFKKREQLKLQRAPQSQRKLLEEHIADMEEKFRERSRLLSCDAPQDAGRSHADSDSGGDTVTTGTGTPVEIPGNPPWEKFGEEPVS